MKKINLNNFLVKFYKKSKKLGRGSSSKKGDKCERGNKGQKSRSGCSIKFFEGGQTRFYRLLPKCGFSRTRNVKKYNFLHNINSIYSILMFNFKAYMFKLHSFYLSLNSFFLINEKRNGF